MRLPPQLQGNIHGLEFLFIPPNPFIAEAVQFAMMTAAERDGELIADLHADGPRLGKAQMVGIGWLPAADETGLRGHKLKVSLVAQPLGLGDSELALVDPVGWSNG